MKPRSHRAGQVGLVLLSATTIALLAVVDMGRTSPGELTAVHQLESGLAGKSGCSECHGGWLSNMTDACFECHADIEGQIEASDGLHGAVGRNKSLRCALCHSEHHGAGFAIVNLQSFKQAGVARAEEFEHRMVGFEMDGRHLELDCAECHPNARAKVLVKGERRYLGLDQDCVTCHEDPHEGRMVVGCASCHGQQAFDQLHSLGHDRFLPLLGGHAGVACRECHAENEAYSLEVLGLGRDLPQPRECLDCHDSPHDEPFVDAVASLVGLSRTASCVACHAAEHESFADGHESVTAELHARSGFPLDPPHDRASCEDCHAPELEEFPARYPGRGPDACSSCHADPHGGQFAQGPFSTGDCLACHEREQFEPHAFSLEKHALAAFALTGRHLETGCDECHELPPDASAGEAPRVFRGTPSRCEQCHADAHRGFFEPFGSESFSKEACASCHDTTSFSDVPDGRFDHARWTNFAVLGAHEQGGCASCHPAAEAPDETGRRFGRVEERFGSLAGCSTCHEDPHGGEFDRGELPREVSGRAGCARCHSEVSFRILPHGFGHGEWTGFTLAGPHAAVGCAICHPPVRQPELATDPPGRTWKRAPGAGCIDCHDDPHAGQFDVGGATDCQRCHASEVASLLAFDHERDSRFSLGEAHEALECSACHLPLPADSREGPAVVRYRPLGTECFDCHGVQEEVLLRKQPKKK